MATLIKFVIIAMIALVALCLWNQIIMGAPACDPITIVSSLIGSLLCTLAGITIGIIEAIIAAIVGLLGISITLPTITIPGC